jgi:tRNA (guanine37-N1)-methyltransferase
LTYQRRRDLIDYDKLSDYQKKLYIELLQEEEKRLDNLNYYVALLHHPVYDREKKVITTSVTNMDIHDICRSSATFGAKKYFVTNPVESQRNLVGRIIHFWTKGFGSTYHKNRNAALEKIEVLSDLQAAIERIEELEGKSPLLIATSAKYTHDPKKFIEFKKAKKIICQNRPVLLIFGTGWGLTEEVLNKCEYQLEPIVGTGEFNHLSVRSAVAVILDRLTQKNYTD